jgi:hypothetical protein
VRQLLKCGAFIPEPARASLTEWLSAGCSASHLVLGKIDFVGVGVAVGVCSVDVGSPLNIRAIVFSVEVPVLSVALTVIQGVVAKNTPIVTVVIITPKIAATSLSCGNLYICLRSDNSLIFVESFSKPFKASSFFFCFYIFF